MASRLVGFELRKVRSTADTSATGTRNDTPVSLPFNSGRHSATALAAPVEAGMMFVYALRPPRQSFLLGPSCVGCVAVTACTVIIKPSSRPKLSFTTFAIGARQFVVHEALEMIVSVLGLYFS